MEWLKKKNEKAFSKCVLELHFAPNSGLYFFIFKKGQNRCTPMSKFMIIMTNMFMFMDIDTDKFTDPLKVHLHRIFVFWLFAYIKPTVYKLMNKNFE
jgi:hypothetical protein